MIEMVLTDLSKAYDCLPYDLVNLILVYGRIGRKTQDNTVISKRLFIQKPTQTSTTGLSQAPRVGPPGVKLFSKLNSS